MKYNTLNLFSVNISGEEKAEFAQAYIFFCFQFVLSFISHLTK